MKSLGGSHLCKKYIMISQKNDNMNISLIFILSFFWLFLHFFGVRCNKSKTKKSIA